MKNFLYLLKTNQNFKTKVLRAIIFLCLFIVGISVFAFSNDGEGAIQISEKNMISTNYIPGDSIGIAMNKEEIYVFEENMLSDKEISLGKSITEEKVEQQNNNRVLEEYIKNIKESFDKVQSTENVISNKESNNVKASRTKNYSSLKPKKRKINNSNKEAKYASANNEQPSISDLEKRRILLQIGKRFSENSKNIKVNIDGNQTIKSGQYVRLKTMEDAVIEKMFVPKYSPIMASVGFGKNRLIMNVSSVRINNEIINCHFDVYGLDGLPGLPVNLEVDQPSIEEDVTNEVENEVRGVVSMTRIGRMASNIFRAKKKPAKVNVKVLNNTNLMLIQNKQ